MRERRRPSFCAGVDSSRNIQSTSGDVIRTYRFSALSQAGASPLQGGDMRQNAARRSGRRFMPRRRVSGLVRSAPSRPLTGVFRVTFPEGPLPGTGGVLFLPRSRGGVICCFFTEQSMFFSGRHAFTPWHGASGRKRTMLNEKALTMFHRKGLTFSGSPRRT